MQSSLRKIHCEVKPSTERVRTTRRNSRVLTCQPKNRSIKDSEAVTNSHTQKPDNPACPRPTIQEATFSHASLEIVLIRCQTLHLECGARVSEQLPSGLQPQEHSLALGEEDTPSTWPARRNCCLHPGCSRFPTAWPNNPLC